MKKLKTVRQVILDKILYIGDEIPEVLMKDKRAKFILLGTPQEFIDETSVPEMLNKDFLNDLPGIVCVQLDDLATKYGGEEWFATAWEEYRQHVKTSSMDIVKMPGFVFNKFLTPNTLK
jgi:hypothetical protein